MLLNFYFYYQIEFAKNYKAVIKIKFYFQPMMDKILSLFSALIDTSCLIFLSIFHIPNYQQF